MIIRDCLSCGGQFELPNNSKGKFCSRTCYFIHVRSFRSKIPCEICGKVSEVQSSLAKYKSCCSVGCRQIRSLRKKEERKAMLIIRDKEKETSISIYALLTSRDRPVYVGRTRCGRETKRLNEHLRVGPCSHFYTLKMKILETVPAEIWREKERWWMWHYEIEQGIQLLNRCNGGGGGSARDEGGTQGCPICGKSFEVPKGQVGRRKFCSKFCFYDSLKKFHVYSCGYCKKNFTPAHRMRRRFCSHECYVLFSRKTDPITCPECQKIFRRTPFRLKKVKNPTCSRVCFYKQMQKGLVNYDKAYGENHPHTKLTEKDATYIIQMQGKIRTVDLMKKFQIGKSTVHNIWTGRSWKYIPRP